jgi:hypothetical protein
VHACFCLWLFVHDDWCVDGPAADNEPATWRATYSRLLNVLAARPVGRHDPLSRALRDIRGRIATRAGSVWAGRFCEDIVQYLQANDWERRGRARHPAPDLSTYTRMRYIAGAMVPTWTLLQLTNDVAPDASFLRHVDLRVMNELAANHVCWVNDILGFRKELDEHSLATSC